MTFQIRICQTDSIKKNILICERKNIVRSEFENLVHETIRNELKCIAEKYSEDDIAHLPRVVQNYFRYCGYLGKSKLMHAEIIWTDVYHKRNKKSNWMKLNYYQFNSAYKPIRIVRIYAKLMGVISMDIAEEYIKDKGYWRMKLLKKINLIDVKGIPELNLTGLVTFLSEALILPTIAIAPYISWTEIDEFNAKAVLKYNNIEVGGIFTFNSMGEFVRFETVDRYNSEDGKKYEKCKWIGVCSDYSEREGIKFPTLFKASWETDEGNFEYFSGRIKEIAEVDVQ